MFFVELMVLRIKAPTRGERNGLDTRQARKQPVDIERLTESAMQQPMQTKLPSRINNRHASDSRVARTQNCPDEISLAENQVFHAMESYSAKLVAIFILEFGIIFHSIFIGLTLAVTGEGFIPLYVVLVFHQTFEGIGLGSRLCTIKWPAHHNC